MSEKIKIAIPIGDINGIGIEVIMKTFLDERMLEMCTPVIYGSTKAVSYHRNALNMENINYNTTPSAETAKDKQINIVNCWKEEVPIQLGKATEVAGEYAYKALDHATEEVIARKADALVTAPIHKKSIQSKAFRFPGHTEYLTEKTNAGNSMLFMISESLKIGLVTGHLPLKDISGKVTSKLVYDNIELLNQSLIQDFCIEKPRIALLGLNPHAGDEGLLGTEETAEIAPALHKAKEEGQLIYGPYPADGFFGSGNWRKFDGILAMYHDQGLVPFKLLSFGKGVNFTAGLPIIRTSPDHGTAYDLAGKNKASPDSFRSAVYLALDIVKNRKMYQDSRKNPLKKSELTSESG